MSKKQYIKLNDTEISKLKELQTKGTSGVRTQKRIIALLELNKGQTQTAVGQVINQSTRSIGQLISRYKSKGLSCIKDEPRPGRPMKISPEQRDKIAVLACEDSPEGYSQWSLRLLADHVVELGHCESISHTQIKKILSEKNLNHT